MPVSSDLPAARMERRTTMAILVGMAVPVAALAVMSWLTPGIRADAPRPALTGAGGVIIPGVMNPARPMRVEVIASYPHDRGAFTQGLHYENGILYESTGPEGESTIRRVDPKTGRVLQSVPLARDLWGEGLARTPQHLIQLTWQNDTGLVWDPATLALQRTFTYKGDGWGLCYDGTSLVMTDGSPMLKFRKLETFEIQRTVKITLDDVSLKWVNELECVKGSLYGNVWRRDFIVKIDPATGIVREKIDASGLLTASEAKGVDFLNGIAYDPADDTFYITGKRWPKLFKVRFVPAGT
ncbi:MAG: glutaminyl-peptide cyclotransferase [Vicinamibacteraceae bacterium]